MNHHCIASYKACAACHLGKSGCHFSGANQPQALQGGAPEWSDDLSTESQYKRPRLLASPVRCGRAGNRQSVSNKRSGRPACAGHGEAKLRILSVSSFPGSGLHQLFLPSLSLQGFGPWQVRENQERKEVLDLHRLPSCALPTGCGIPRTAPGNDYI